MKTCRLTGIESFIARRSRMMHVLHDVAERGKIVVTLEAVHTVVEDDQPDVLLPQNFHDLVDFEIIAPQPAHVLDDDGFHTSRLDFLHHSRISGAVEPGAGNAVVGEVGRARETVFSGVVLQHLLLMNDAVAFAVLLIVAAQTLV